jgi:hypothetical protein
MESFACGRGDHRHFGEAGQPHSSHCPGQSRGRRLKMTAVTTTAVWVRPGSGGVEGSDEQDVRVCGQDFATDPV